MWPGYPYRGRRELTGFSILGGSSVGVAGSAGLEPAGYQPFQYPRRIECGCGGAFATYYANQRTSFSILGGSSVGVALSRARQTRLVATVSVSSADRVWVWLVRHGSLLLYFIRFSILGGSSVGVAFDSDIELSFDAEFQYPRRIECGCGFSHGLEVCCLWQFQYPRRIECGCGGGVRPPEAAGEAFQYPRRIECGCGSMNSYPASFSRFVSVSSADRVWVWPPGRAAPTPYQPGFSILGGSSVGVAGLSR